ncbi:MAG TPA: multidrug ABC transporter permease [Oscillibacter sp.]|jgi:ABC-type multidrug transport system fused ATPase/permease subunit|nr:MAG: multidrug ABC transporter permease [Oscillibacter sp.]HCV06203.1 multidrug ABC transporter permease [Oscillibacter sp.]
MRQEDNRQPMGSESLGTLVSSWRDGTFSEIWADWKWIWGYTKRYRRAVWFYTILGVASSTLGLVSAVASKYSIDIITGYDSDHLWFIVTVMVASALVGLLLRSVTSRISTKISLRVNNDIQAQVFDRLLGADWRSLNAFASGDLLSRLSTDVGSVSSSAIRWLPDLIVTAYTFAATLAVILHYDWVMALLALASAPFLLLTSRRLIRGMRTHQQEVRQVGSRLMSYETETLHNLDAIKGFGITGRYGRGFRRRQEEFRRASLDYNLFSIRTEILLSLLGSAVQMAAFGYCLYLLWSGKILYGTMTLFLSQGAKLSSAFNALVRTVPSFLSASVSARRIRDLYALEPEPVLPDDGLDSLASQGFTVAVEDAGYAYVPHQPVLTHADFRAAPGETVALVGPSGGGKTTMIRLLLGLIRPAEGRAYLQAADGRQVEVNAGLRRYFSYVPQGNTLLSGTIADNLRMVKPDASDAQLRAALEAACAWDFVSAMDGGLDASVGEHGHGLSEGQAQRIAIARALLRDAPVLLLDEATSALDVATERTILRNLAARYPHKTCIVTTHRPTVISLCCRVYQVSSGCLRLLDSDEAQRLAMDF